MADAESTYFDATDTVSHYTELCDNHDVLKSVSAHDNEAGMVRIPFALRRFESNG